jgi:hypothetical protein
MNKVMLWLLEGPVWWAGPALILGGTLAAALLAEVPPLGLIPVAAVTLMAVLFVGVRPGMSLAVIALIAAYILFSGRTGVLECVCLGAVALGTLWMFSRRSQFEHYRGVAAHHKPTCPVCGYDYRSASADVCPECGTNVPEYLARVRKAVK